MIPGRRRRPLKFQGDRAKPVALVEVRLPAAGGRGYGLADFPVMGTAMDDDQTNTEGGNTIGGIAAEALRQAIERIERLEEEKKALSDDIKEVYGQAKAQGFDPKIIRQIVRMRKMEEAEREETEQLLDLYKAAIGMA